METNKKYLRKLGVYLVTVDGVKTTEWKGTESLTMVLKATDGALIDAKWKKPFTEYASKQIKGVMELLKVNKLTDTVGKSVAVLVEPNEWQGKIYWRVNKFFDSKYVDDFNFGTEITPDATNDLTAEASSDIPF